MPTITINGESFEFDQGQTILQVALDNEIEIPHYCYHPGLSIVANCRICLAEVWAPNPRNDNALEPIPKLLPACQTPAGDGQAVYTDSPKAIANQKAVMEYLLINHPVDCPVCDQAGECHLQDYSYQYGRGQARFAEQKIKQPKKDVGSHVLLYSDRCIMCTRCVRFTREVTGTGELLVDGGGAMEQIDVFPGMGLENPLSGNVIDICPVGALLDKDFLFQQRVWFLHKTPSIDGLTCSGDNIFVEHNNDTVYRLKPRTNLDVNQWWITDELRYGWKFVHSDQGLCMPAIRGDDAFETADAADAYEQAYAVVNEHLAAAECIGLVVSPMLSCEDAFLLADAVSTMCDEVAFAIGPVLREGEDTTFPGGFTMYAEKAPNARGVRAVLAAFGTVLEFDALMKSPAVDALVLTGNYPSNWATDALLEALDAFAGFTLLIDTLASPLVERADVVLPGATWMEKPGTFVNVNERHQAFERAVRPAPYAKSEAQIAIDLLAASRGERPVTFNAANTRQRMAGERGLASFASDVHMPAGEELVVSDMEMVEL